MIIDRVIFLTIKKTTKKKEEGQNRSTVARCFIKCPCVWCFLAVRPGLQGLGDTSQVKGRHMPHQGHRPPASSSSSPDRNSLWLAQFLHDVCANLTERHGEETEREKKKVKRNHWHT